MKCLTGDIYLGWIEIQMRPVRMSVTAKERVNISARDCELSRRLNRHKNKMRKKRRLKIRNGNYISTCLV